MRACFSYRNLDPGNIRTRRVGGGALMDIGCYPINVARMMFDAEPTDVSPGFGGIPPSVPTC